MKYTTVDVDVDIYEVMSELTNDELQQYVEEHLDMKFYFDKLSEEQLINLVTEKYFHGDIDIVKLIENINPKNMFNGEREKLLKLIEE